jgi:hypothetical protein
MMYELIDIPSTRHVLDRERSCPCGREWPVLPAALVHDSYINLIKPHTPLEILLACQLVKREASPILKRRIKDCYRQPLQLLIDYSAASSLFNSLK